MTDERITALPRAAASPASNAEWHVIYAGKEVGPLTLAELIEKAATGHMEADDLVKQIGGLWTKAREFAFLKDARAERRRQRSQRPLLNDSKENEIESAPPQTSQEKGTVSPAAWVMFTLGAFLFLLGPHGTDLLAYGVWGLIFAVPGYFCFKNKQRGGMTMVATLFFLAAGLDVAGAVYLRYAFQPALRRSAIVPTDGIIPGRDQSRNSLPRQVLDDTDLGTVEQPLGIDPKKSAGSLGTYQGPDFVTHALQIAGINPEWSHAQPGHRNDQIHKFLEETAKRRWSGAPEGTEWKNVAAQIRQMTGGANPEPFRELYQKLSNLEEQRKARR